VDPSGNSLGIRIKNSSSLPVDMIEVQVDEFLCGGRTLVRAHNLLKLRHEDLSQLGGVGHCFAWHVRVPSGLIGSCVQ